AELKALTRIIHPAVRRRIDETVRRIGRQKPGAVVVLDIPLLFESGHYTPDAVVVVTAPLQAAARRLKGRSGWSLAEVKRRGSFQMPLKEKVGRADFVVHNGGSLQETRRQVAQVWKSINRRA
ncbi:MAG: dephospho-CoA kinase, partial [Candidatus Omnitrophica bacterium]|nr:dephospho-CoA kinase [Candidatus Omnitrophota bacterium]